MDSIDLYADFNEEADARGGHSDEENPGVRSDSENDNKDDENKEVVDAKLKIVRVKRKLHTLNVERLKGPRGIIAIDDFFQNMKFKGKGYEKQDLDNVMKRLEHWAHR
jgi:TIMELESS-interacting protein